MTGTVNATWEHGKGQRPPNGHLSQWLKHEPTCRSGGLLPLLCLDKITRSSDDKARVGVLKPECRKKLKKKPQGEKKISPAIFTEARWV